MRNVERLIEELHYHEVRSATLTLYVSYHDDAPGAGVVRLGVPTDRFERLLEAARVKREVNERFGRFKLRSGATLFANDFYTDPANGYDVCDVRGKFCF